MASTQKNGKHEKTDHGKKPNGTGKPPAYVRT